jgi:hypothetical protein
MVIHDQLTCFLIIPKNLGGMQNFVHQGSFSVVNVGDDSNVSNIHEGLLKTRKGSSFPGNKGLILSVNHRYEAL